MSNTQTRNIVNGPDKARLKDMVFEPQKGITATFVLESGFISGTVRKFDPDYQLDGKSWTFEIHDSSRTPMYRNIKCRYNSETRKGQVVFETEDAMVG